jgi:hypothetical protein
MASESHITPSTGSRPVSRQVSRQFSNSDAFARLDRSKRTILSQTCEKLTWLFEVSFCELDIGNFRLFMMRVHAGGN